MSILLCNNMRVPRDPESIVEKMCKMFQEHSNRKGMSGCFFCKNVFLFVSIFLGGYEEDKLTS